MTRPPEIQAIFDAFDDAGPYQSIEDANRGLTALMGAYNRRPQAALGGLSPDQMAQLLHGDWASHGALRLNESLSNSQVEGASFLADARTLMTYVRDHCPVKVTSAGNLPRAVVAALLPQLRMPWGYSPSNVEEARPRNEGDVRWLSPLRYVLTFAKLLARRKGVRLTARGQAFLADDRAGELYALLFRTLFGGLDLRALDSDYGHPDLQGTVAYSFYKLRDSSGDWTSAQELAQHAWLASAQDPPSEWEAGEGEDLRYYTFKHRVLDPLAQFGLLEERSLPGEVWWKGSVEYRRTTLFDRFMRFEFRR